MGTPERRQHAQGLRLLRDKIHAAVCAVTGLPLAWQVETGRRNESPYVAPLLDAVRARGFTPDTVAVDRGYDNNRVYDECHERGIAPVIPLRKGRIQPETPIKRVPRNGPASTAAARR